MLGAAGLVPYSGGALEFVLDLVDTERSTVHLLGADSARQVSHWVGWIQCCRSHFNSNRLIHPAREKASAGRLAMHVGYRRASDPWVKADGFTSLGRVCQFAAHPSPFSSFFNKNEEEVSAKSQSRRRLRWRWWWWEPAAQKAPTGRPFTCQWLSWRT